MILLDNCANNILLRLFPLLLDIFDASCSTFVTCDSCNIGAISKRLVPAHIDRSTSFSSSLATHPNVPSRNVEFPKNNRGKNVLEIRGSHRKLWWRTPEGKRWIAFALFHSPSEAAAGSQKEAKAEKRVERVGSCGDQS